MEPTTQAHTLHHPAPHAQRGWLRVLFSQWVVVPIVALVLCEALLRYGLVRPVWYEKAEQEAVAHPIDYIFIGSSRVAAAIDTAVFETIMGKQLGRPVHALNMGMGYSTWIEHDLGLSRLLHAAPAHLKQCTVLIEAPGEIVSMGDWTDAWASSVQPEQILSILRARDLPAVWHSPARMWTKIGLTADYLGGRSVMFSRRAFIRQSILEKGAMIIRSALQGLESASPIAESAPDLANTGGIRANAEGVQQARKLAAGQMQEAMKKQTEITDWSSPVYDDLRQNVEREQGRVVLYAMPQSTLFSQADATATGQCNRQTFLQQIGSMHALLLHPEFSYRDEDFPDLWHLRKSRVPEFTAALAKAYIQATSNSLSRQ